MSIRYLDLSGAVNFWTNIKNYILSKIPTKTSELTNDSGFLTQHQSLSNYVTLNTAQEITSAKTFKNATIRKLTSVEAGNVIPSSDKMLSDIWQDKNGKELGRIYYTKTSGGNTALIMRAGDWFTSNEGVYTLDASGTNRRAELVLYTNSSGDCCIQPNGYFSAHLKPLNSSICLAEYGKPFGVAYVNQVRFTNATLQVDVDIAATEEHSIGFFGKNNGPLSYITFQKRPSFKDRVAIRIQTTSSSYKSYDFDATCFYPESSNSVDIGSTTNIFKNIYCNNYYKGTTAFGDIVTHNASEFLTSHQSLSSCVKNVVTNSQTIKSTAITRGTAPSSAQTFGIAFSDNNNKYIGNIYGQYATDKSTYVGLYAYKGSTTSNGDNAYVRVGYDASGNVYTSAPTPATADNSTQIATTAFVKAQGYLTSHPSITLSSNTTSTASPAHGGTFTCIDSVTQDTNGHITKVNTKTITLPADSNTDTKVTQTVTTANSNYPVLLCATANATETGTTTSRFSEGLAVNARYSSISMTNKYDTANTKGVRDSTKGYLNGDIIFKCYDASEMGRIHCESSKNGYQQTYMQARSYIKNGAISPEGTATTCYITVRVRDNGSKTIYTDGSWENSLTPYANETYNLGTSSLRWMNCYCKNFYGSYVDIAGRYIGNEASTNSRSCLYLKANRDTDGKSGLYVTKFRTNVAQGSMGSSDVVFLSHDILENETRTNAGFVESYSNWTNNVPGGMSVYSTIATRNLGTSAKPWTNAYITNLNLNGHAFDPTSTSGKVGDVVFAGAYYSSITGTARLDLTVPGNALYLAGFNNDTLVIDATTSLTGTWKFLGIGKPTTTSGNADTKRVGLWKRIA